MTESLSSNPKLSDVLYFLEHVGECPTEEIEVKVVSLLLIKEEIERLRAALTFYAHPETYFAIGLYPDLPCGEFMEDFSDTGPSLGQKPGKRAREALEISLGVKLEPDEVFETSDD